MPVVNDLSVSTQDALADGLESLMVAEPVKKKRGRPPKIRPIIEEPIIEDDEEEIVCPKCGVDDPGDWSQCKGCCPMPESPCYDATWLQKKTGNPFPPDGLPEFDDFGKWKTFNVSETSAVFLKWYMECEKIVLEGWKLKLRSKKKFIGIVMHNGHQTRPFAFIRKNTGNIHTPMTNKDPFIHFVGNILDPATRLSVITPFGVRSHWEWLPTHPQFDETLAKNIMGEYDSVNDDESEGDIEDVD